MTLGGARITSPGVLSYFCQKTVRDVTKWDAVVTSQVGDGNMLGSGAERQIGEKVECATDIMSTVPLSPTGGRWVIPE